MVQTPLPANVTITDLAVGTTTTGVEPFETIQTIAGIPTSVQLTLLQMMGPAATARVKLTANTTFYVRSGGADIASHTGLSNTDGVAFATFNYAYTQIRQNYDFNGFAVTIQMQNATWTSPWLVGGPSLFDGWVGGGKLIIDGGGGTLHTTGATAIDIKTMVPSYVAIQNVTLTTTGSGDCVFAELYALVGIGNITFGACAGNHVHSSDYAVILGGDVNLVTGGATGSHLIVDTPFGWIFWFGGSETFSNNPVFGGAYAFAESNGKIWAGGTTFNNAGTVTGQRALAIQGGSIQTPSANYFPGSISDAFYDAEWQNSTGGGYDVTGLPFPTHVAGTYPKASLPTSASPAGMMIYVPDETGGTVMAFSDGTNWRRCTDRAIVS